ncbi:MAG TPA: enterotoxin [Gemmatimonadales bacterium]
MGRISRREFVEWSASAAAALSLSGCATVSRQSGGRPFVANSPALNGTWDFSESHARPISVTDKKQNVKLTLPIEVFTLILADGSTIPASSLRVAGDGGHEANGCYAFRLEDPAGRLRADWCIRLVKEAPYFRQDITLAALGAELPIKEVVLLDFDVPNALVVGDVKGSPVCADDWFMAFEHPLALNTVTGTRVRCSLPRELPLRPGAPVTYSSIIGCVTHGQRRRGFLQYVEHARAHRYRPFLHYNSWYDIGYFSKYDEAAALDVINTYGRELHEKRGVTLDSFLFDDGWDDTETLWHFHSGFPHGFTPLKEAAARYGTAPGVWMSPWGGYGQPRQQRLTAGKAQGFETNERGFALSGPKYYERFRETCKSMMADYGVNQFKFDGTGNVSRVFPGSRFDSDFDAMISLIGELRTAKPDLFVNLTTGTYPSPFFLRYCDSIWRGGEDHEFAGVGSFRQKWITYKDGDTYQGIVKKGPLFPLNSLMLHGLIYAKHAKNLDTDPGNDFASEIQAYFGTGTQLQEMYVTPSLLTSENWDTLARAARWARDRAHVLVDTHWIGGDPLALEPYGHAAWDKGFGLLTLRNPKDTPQTMEIDLIDAWDFSRAAADANIDYSLRSPWDGYRTETAVKFTLGKPTPITLEPFQVLTLETV